MADTKITKRNLKDSVFTDLFKNKSRLFELYKALHPEDTQATEDDISNVTLESVLMNDIYNDLGFAVGNRLIVLVEAQSTWSINIILRSLFYLAQTLHDYTDEKEYDLYSSIKVSIPKPELYVVYTGDRKTRPEFISFSKEFFGGEEVCVEVKVKMLYGDGNDILCQYVAFTKVYDEQRKKYGRYDNRAIKETIRICKDKNILKSYLESREKEVEKIMMALFDEEKIQRNHDITLVKQTALKNAKRNYERKRCANEEIISDISEDLQISLEKAEEIFQREVLGDIHT